MKTMLKRGAGVLMPIFSLPSPYGIGTFGRAAYEFIDQLKRGRQTYWQVLPMGPTCYGDSPYQSYSAFAGNPYFIDLDTLKDEKLLTQDEIDACWWCDKQDQVKYDALYYYRFPLLRKAYERSSHKESVEYQAFLEENEEWLDDYALYISPTAIFTLFCFMHSFKSPMRSINAACSIPAHSASSSSPPIRNKPYSPNAFFRLSQARRIN